MRIHQLLSVACSALFIACRHDISEIEKCSVVLERLPRIIPDYGGIVLPPNIAPLNFKVMEPGTRYCAKISSSAGDPVTVVSAGPSIRIPETQWRNLLARNSGNELHINIYVRDSLGLWYGYRPLRDTVARLPIDRYLTYRTLGFLYNLGRDLRLYQRDLETSVETQMINADNFSSGSNVGCSNCHTPCNNDPRNFVVQTRSAVYGSGTIIAAGGKLIKVNSRLGYASWRPDGDLIAFTVYKVLQCFHSVRRNFIDVYDNSSNIIIYDVKKGKIISPPQLFQKQVLETWPDWSPDGRYLYFCSAPVLWTDVTKEPPDNYDKTMYSLLRVEYDAASKTWGSVDTVLSAQRTGLSISQPRLSPDGRFILLCMHAYGAYPHAQKSSDLYLFELATGSYRPLDVINSDYQEMWHGWSANGRWIVFSSKRDGGIFTRLYFSFVDSSGVAHKAFIMPQKDPAFYDKFIKSYNVPEFADAPIPFSERDLLKVIRAPAAVNLPVPKVPDSTLSASNHTFLQNKR